MAIAGEITLRPTSDFSVNGAARGTLVAYDHDEEPLWEHRGNWSDRKVQISAAEDLAEVLGITTERAKSLIHAAISTARKLGDASRRAAPAVVQDAPTIAITERQLYELSDECWKVLQEANEE